MTLQHLVRTLGSAKLARAAARNRFDCRQCGRGVAVDEDGCCRTCGGVARPVVWRDPTVAKHCAVCKHQFFASKPTAKTCSDRCRQIAHRLAAPAAPVTAASQELSQQPAVTPAFWPELPPNPQPVTPPVTAVSQHPPLSTPPPPAAPPSPAALTFPTVGQGGARWDLREAKVTEWQALYPGLDILGESRRALAWIEASPERRKTSRGMERFLVAWLNRATDRPRLPMAGFAGSLKTANNKANIEEFLRRRDALDES